MKSLERIAVLTTTRADYGLLKALLERLRDDASFDLRVIATGTHLAPEFGLTVEEIEADGFSIDERVEIVLSSDTPVATAKAMALETIGIGEALARQRPDLLVVLGDRFEVLSAVQAAVVARVPVGHIAGGERTDGAFDDAIRHAVTKLSQLHFVSAEPYRRRVVQLGEEPNRVFNVGAPGIEHLRCTPPLSRAELERQLGFPLKDRFLLVTYHPETLADRSPSESVRELLDALSSFTDLQLLITYPNADTYGRHIIDQIETFAAQYPGRALVTPSLGQARYVSALRGAAVVVGNSSSGIIEAPAVPVPTVNIGARQAGRLRAPTIVDCKDTCDAIRAALDTALDPEFLRHVGDFSPPYGDGRTSEHIVSILRSVDAAELVRKRFFDIPHDH